MPAWDAPASADAALVASFQSYLDALYCHEYGHGKLALDCANAIYDALTAQPGNADCDALNAASLALFQGLLDGCTAREADYDSATMHGATMGAVFPP
jgi:predicted secreted Zn-dependent protease